MIDLNELSTNDHCLVVDNINVDQNNWLWHHRLGHASVNQITKLIQRNLVKGIPQLNSNKNKICYACPLELLHLDLFGPTRTTSLGEKRYGLVIIDDYSRYTWVLFLAHKDKTFMTF